MHSKPLGLFFGDGDEQFVEVVPERKLLLAVLNRALADLFSSNREARADAIEWFKDNRSEDDECHPRIPFSMIADTFQFSAERRKKLELFFNQTEEFDKDKRCQVVRVRMRVS